MLKLPKIALYEIVTKLNLSDLRSLCQTTKKYNKICVDESFWKFKFRREFGELPMSNYLSYRELYIWRLWSNLNFYRPRSWIRLLFPDNSLRQNVKKKISLGYRNIAILLWSGELYTGGIDNKYYTLGRRVQSDITHMDFGIYPFQVAATNVIDIETGEYSTYYLNDSYQLFGLGKLVYKQIK